MEKYIFSEDVRLLDGAQQLGRLTVLGPRAHLLLQKVMDAGVETLTDPFRHAKRLIGKTTITVFRNDLAGEPQYELIVPRDQLVSLWQILHEAGGHPDTADNGDTLRAIGWSAFNTARIEAGTPIFGIDLSDHYLPMETAHWYPRAVSVTKGCYIGQEIVARMHAHNTVARLLVGLRIKGDKLPDAGTDILDPAATAAGAAPQVGIVTSSCMSPMLGNAPIAIGYVKRAFATPGKPLEVLAEGVHAPTEVAPLPLWQKK
jgi:folate-binding protein YgfZ